MKTSLLVLAFALGLTGCVNFGEKGSTAAMVNYVLTDTRPDIAPPPPASKAPTLLVLDTTSTAYYDNEQLVFSRSPPTRGYYQYARWTERPGKRIADLVRTRLAQSGTWHVTAAGGYVRGDLLLDTELIELYHDASTPPGQVRLALRAELVDLKRRALLGRRVFEQVVPVEQFDASGAATASNIALGRLLDDLGTWLASFR